MINFKNKGISKEQKQKENHVDKQRKDISWMQMSLDIVATLSKCSVDGH